MKKINILLFSYEDSFINSWKRNDELNVFCVYSRNDVKVQIKKIKNPFFVVDYNSISSELLEMISDGELPNKTIVVDSYLDSATGKMLLSQGVKAYVRDNVLSSELDDIFTQVKKNKIWVSPELSLIAKRAARSSFMNPDSLALINKRLTPREKEVVNLILQSLNNNAISSKMSISIRTVKAHISAILSKLRVNDRVSLLLLLK